MSPEAVAQAVIRSACERLPFAHFRVFLFGSRASGEVKPGSDYDIGIDAGAKIPLGCLALIEDDLERLPVLQKFDVVDFFASPEEFARRALESARIIYEQ
ncbi:MAG: nucleotidyltransferase domain-containing protein [Elusimicrobia bacterium]|nr:nucleotidyltransferase domain-containing protein [Elusimicrobiota bacterium]